MILGTAVAMLVVGQTGLKPHLDGLGYIMYWLICAALTFVALMFAFVDLHTVRRGSKDQQRELIEDALEGLPPVPEARRGGEDRQDP